jgi:Flp pilus assembly pilin Flp
MITNKSKTKAGQALVEYLLLFSFVAFLSVGMVKGLGRTLTKTVGYIGYELTEQFTIGVCQSRCFYDKYENQEAVK